MVGIIGMRGSRTSSVLEDHVNIMASTIVLINFFTASYMSWQSFGFNLNWNADFQLQYVRCHVYQIKILRISQMIDRFANGHSNLKLILTTLRVTNK